MNGRENKDKFAFSPVALSCFPRTKREFRYNSRISKQKFVVFGRVEPGSYLPGTPTDPDVPN
jgi:hypothetical protein